MKRRKYNEFFAKIDKAIRDRIAFVIVSAVFLSIGSLGGYLIGRGGEFISLPNRVKANEEAITVLTESTQQTATWQGQTDIRLQNIEKDSAQAAKDSAATKQSIDSLRLTLDQFLVESTK